MMAQQQLLGKANTKVFTKDGYTTIQYHDTEVVKFNDKEIILDSDGFRTQSTKDRMNQASNQFDLGYRVYTLNYRWFVMFKDVAILFKDKMKLMR